MILTVKNLQKKLTVEVKILRRIARKLLLPKYASKTAEIAVLLVDDKIMKELNLLYSGQTRTTDVLSFDGSANPKELRLDIAISTDAAIRNAEIFKTSAFYEVYLYLAHGLLHSLGYNDDTPKKRALMQKKAETILKYVYR